MNALSVELLQQVEQAEAKAEELRAAAQREAREMFKSVEDAALAAQRAANLAHRDLAAEVLSKAEAATRQEISAAGAKEAAARADEQAKAQQRLEQAAAMIFERVVSDGHR